MTRQGMKRAGVAVAAVLALCVMSSPSGAGGIWGGGRRMALDSRSSESGRAGWRQNEGSRAGWRLSEGSRAGWRLYTFVQAMRAGW